MLPISLIISLEIVKVVQSFFIMNDARMFCMERDRKAKVSSTSIIEELGQVNYIFSDKTGTLTRNIMEFKYLAVGLELYGRIHDLDPGPEKLGKLQRKVTHTDTKSGIEYTFESKELTNILHGE